jgi:ketosteroid isomerase-like protein
VLAHELVGGSWIESDMKFFDGGREIQREQYTQIRVNVPVDDASFLPSGGRAVPSWIPASGPGTMGMAPAVRTQGRTPQAVVDELLATDRAFSASGANTDLVSSISAMLADDVIMPTPPGRFAKGKADVIAALKANPANAQSKTDWTPVRGGVSADGLHGFTFGMMNVRLADGTVNAAKYLSYWVKGAAGWRVTAFKRGRAAAGDVAGAMMTPALPPQLVAPSTSAGLIEQHRASLVAAEQAFSDLAQRIGLGPAFRESGSADAINLGGPAVQGFVLGSEAIGRAVQGAAPESEPQAHWSADTAFVASSGDLGVTFGFVKANAPPPAGQPAGQNPFFTIWRRAGPGAPWKYVAE